MSVVEILVTVLGAAALLLAWMVSRRLRLFRRGGIDVAVRSPRGRWVVGIGHYRGEEFLWYRVWSLRTRPDLVLRRGRLDIVDRAESGLAESELRDHGLAGDSVVLRCAGGPGAELAMESDAAMGFQSWLESAPPGHSLPYAS